MQTLTRATVYTRVQLPPVFAYDKVLLNTNSNNLITLEQNNKMLDEIKNYVLDNIKNINQQFIVVKYSITDILYLKFDNDDKEEFARFNELKRKGWVKYGKEWRFIQYYYIESDQ